MVHRRGAATLCRFWCTIRQSRHGQVTLALSTVFGCIAISLTAPHIPLGSALRDLSCSYARAEHCGLRYGYQSSVGRVTSPSMPPAVTHRLAFTTCCSGTSWSVTRSQLPRLWWSSVPIPSTTCTPISRSLFCFQTTRSTASSTSVDTATTQTSMGRRSLRTHCGSWVAVAAMVATLVSRAS